MGVVPAARQPRHDADRRAEPARLHVPLPACRAPSRREAIERALEMANLADRRDTRVDKLSGGMRRRLLIARALVHRPRLVLLDEPTVGLDPQVRQELWALIDALRSEGTSILMSTHYIEEAERLADTVTIMSHGKAVATGPAGGADRRARRPRGDRGLRPARQAARGRGRRPRGRDEHAPHRHLGRDAAARRRRQRRPARGRAPPGQPRGRLRPAHRRGDRMTTAELVRRRTRIGRLERPALQGVLVREVINFSSYWRSVDVLLDRRAHDLPARLRLRLRRARLRGRRLRLRRVRRDRHGRDRGAVRVGLLGDVRDVRQARVPAHLRRDPRRAGRRRGARHRRGAVDRRSARRRLRLHAAARGDGLRARPLVGDAARARASASSPASAGPRPAR